MTDTTVDAPVDATPEAEATPEPKAKAKRQRTKAKASPALGFTADVGDVLAAVTTAARATGATGPTALPMLAMLRFEVSDEALVSVTATNLTATLTTTFAAATGTAHAMLVPAKFLVETLKFAAALGNTTVSITEAADRALVTVQSGELVATATVLLGVDEFPVAPHVGGRARKIDVASLATAARFAMVATSKDPARPLLGAVQFRSGEEGGVAVATDSYRLAWARTDFVLSEEPVLVPASALAILLSLPLGETVAVRCSSEVLSVSTEATTLVVRLLDGDPPKVDAYLTPPATPEAVVTAPRAALIDAARRLAITGAVKLNLVGEPGKGLTMSGHGSERTMKVHLPDVEMTAPVDMDFDPAKLADACTGPGDTVAIHVEGDRRPAHFLGEGTGHVLAPMLRTTAR